MIKLISSYGDENDIQKYARLSYNKHQMDIDQLNTERIIKLLLEKEHFTMFEFQGLTTEVTVPIFIQRQWMRHRLFSYHEISRRYSEITEKDLEDIQYHIPQEIMILLKQQIQDYKNLIDHGFKKEEQRGVIGTYFPTTFLCSGNLREWLHFIKLRLQKKQQKEIRECQNIVFHTIVQKRFPIIYENYNRILEEGGKL